MQTQLLVKNNNINEGFRYLYCYHEVSQLTHSTTCHEHLTYGCLMNHKLTLPKPSTRNALLKYPWKYDDEPHRVLSAQKESVKANNYGSLIS